MGRDKPGSRPCSWRSELGLRYETAWLMAHKLRHGLAERPEALLDGMVEVRLRATTAGAGKPESRGRGVLWPMLNKSLLVLAVEKVAVAPGKGVE